MAAGHAHAPDLLLFLLGCSFVISLLEQPSRAQPEVVKVGLIVDDGSPVGKIATTTIPMAIADFYAASPSSRSRVQILPHDSGGDVVSAASAALQLMTREGAHAILGPQSSVESAFVADLATEAKVPVLSFSSTSPSVSTATARFFSRAALSDAAQVDAIAALVTYFGWRRVVPIYQDDDYGAAFVPFLVDALTGARAEVPYRCALPADASPDAIAAALYRMESEQTRVFVVHTRPALARRVFASAVEAGMMSGGYAWIITDGLTGLLGSIEAPQGVIGLAPYVPSTPRLREVKRRWAHQYMRDHRKAEPAEAEMGCYAVWAYDAAWAIASAAERLSSSDLSPPGLVGGKGGATVIAGIGESRSGEKFLAAIRKTKFEGLGGVFELIGGEFAASVFRVVNIMDNGKERGIGFWTRKNGLTKHIGRRANKTTGELAPVIWPGESTVMPRGWVQPTSARKLRVAVPGSVDPAYRPIMHHDMDPVTRRTVAGGFVVEVFEAAVRLLPYALPFEYVMTESMPYDMLVQNVGYDKRFDVVVADVTITANRSKYVDFTLPYMVSGVSMVVPVRDRRSSRLAWVFLKPLHYDLWLVSAAFFLFTGFAVWAIEHRLNKDFRVPPSYQLGTLLYFGFSTLVFAHRENLRSNLSRFAVVVWIFVVLILQSSYTASLTSMLTVPRLEPTIGDYGALLRSSDNVGIMNNSFMRRYMTTGAGGLFQPARLVPYQSAERFHDALLDGTIAAVIDETPYLKILLKSYRGHFSMSGQLHKTGGFGFAFPKGSPYVTDLSRAILTLTESEEMNMIERKWFGDTSGDDGARSDGPFTSDSLSFTSFWGLFLITGATSLLCCAVHLVTFLADSRQPTGDELASHLSWKGRLQRLTKLFDDKDLSSHTFRDVKVDGGGGSMAGRSNAVVVSPDVDVDDGGRSNAVIVSPAVEHNEGGSPCSMAYTGDLSVGAASPVAGEIELLELEVAPNPDGNDRISVTL